MLGEEEGKESLWVDLKKFAFRAAKRPKIEFTKETKEGEKKDISMIFMLSYP
jgi:hypothetical protein